jgi:hypothetical protein
LLLLRRKGKQRQMTRTLDRQGELTLVLGARTGGATRHDLPSIC